MSRPEAVTPGNRALLRALAVVVVVAAAAGAALLLGGPAEQAPPAANAPAPAGVPTTGGVALDRIVAMAPPGNFGLIAPLQPDGRLADMAPYRGKALLVNYWASWCAPCIEELPSLGKLQAALGGADFAVVTIALDEPDPAKVVPFLARHGAGDLPALIDGNRSIVKVMPMSTLPTSLLVDREGLIRASLTGAADWHCGKALAAVKAFIADGSVSEEKLVPCD